MAQADVEKFAKIIDASEALQAHFRSGFPTAKQMVALGSDNGCKFTEAEAKVALAGMQAAVPGGLSDEALSAVAGGAAAPMMSQQLRSMATARTELLNRGSVACTPCF